MRKDCRNCKRSLNESGHFRPYWLWCKKLFVRVRANKNRCNCMHWCGRQRGVIMNAEVEKFADYLIEWIVSKNDIEFDRQTEFNIVRMIVDCVELYEKGL